MKLVALVAVTTLTACPKAGDHKQPNEPPHPAGDAQSRLIPALDGDLAIVLPPAPPVPSPPAGLPPLPATAAAITPESVALGELLFKEPMLARDGKTTCATCHDPAHGYSGNVDTTATGQRNLRRTPTLVDLAWAPALGWDGRYRSLAEQLPPHVRGQLGDDLEPAIRKLADVPLYKAHLARVGGAPQDAALHALEAFVLTRYDGDSPWDRLEPTARTPKPNAAVDPIVAGYLVFTGKGQCAVCHTPPLYTDFGYHRVDFGLLPDPGRGKIDRKLDGAFKTPTLRGAAARPAFFHLGSKITLQEVIDQYALNSMLVPVDPKDSLQLDPTVHKIRMTPQDQTNLLAFLRALSTPPGAAHPAPGLP